jgi:hypothetical protein
MRHVSRSFRRGQRRSSRLSSMVGRYAAPTSENFRDSAASLPNSLPEFRRCAVGSTASSFVSS